MIVENVLLTVSRIEETELSLVDSSDESVQVIVINNEQLSGQKEDETNISLLEIKQVNL